MLEKITLDVSVMNKLGVPAACLVSILVNESWGKSLNARSLKDYLPYSQKTLQLARTKLISEGYIFKTKLGDYSTTTLLIQKFPTL